MNVKLKSTSLPMATCCFGALAMLLQVNVIHAQGIPLTPGSLVAGPGVVSPVGGTPLASINIPFASASFTGVLTSTVIAGDVSNPLGGLTFTYQYSINSGPDSSGGISLGGFAGFLTDVGYQIPVPVTDVAPSFENRSINGNNIDFFFSSIPVGDSSALLVVQTDAQSFGVNTSTVLDNTGSPNVAELAPVALVGTPEPTSAVFVLLGLGVMASVRRFRKS
jgi:hypothetical protein